ncbi:MAG TPA: arylsulfatase [Opitutaceae bacterium]|nr:arylsulfatase [Opitutaceae bacterium]
MHRVTPVIGFAALSAIASAQAPKPNIVFILADDLGYGEVGCYGQQLIATPNIDRLAAEGMRFRQFYAGNTVCAPSRSVLMTGQHMGHTRVRGNSGGLPQSLAANDVTLARVLRDGGYATGLIGKWGLGLPGEPGAPEKQGFDYYFGFPSQTDAHNYYPAFLWRNGEKVPLPNVVTHLGSGELTGYATKAVAYASDLFAEDAHAFVERNRAKPFFLYLALTAPHANDERARALGDGNEVPDYGPYASKPWTDTQKGHAAMITRMDRDVGALMAQLKQLGLDERTLVIFTSDNGPHREGGKDYDPAFFHASGPLSGEKRDLLEGGIRVPFIARWPGRIKAGAESAQVGYFGDMMATFAELAGAKLPERPLDSVSLVPTLFGRGAQAQHEYFYWEFYERGLVQAVLLGDGRWKGLRPKAPAGPIELFDLKNDFAEKTDVAAKNPEIVSRIDAIMHAAHVDNEYWRFDRPVPASRN